jgi:hypothetical protein
MLNGVVVEFRGVDGNGHGLDVGIWDNPARTFPPVP